MIINTCPFIKLSDLILTSGGSGLGLNGVLPSSEISTEPGTQELPRNVS